jgi:hypothetical protein
MRVMWHLFALIADRHSLLQGVRKWGIPWLAIRRIGRTAEGGDFTRS